MTWPPLRRLREGEVCYVRCRASHGVLAPDGMPTAALKVVNRYGNPVEEREVYVAEEFIITQADMVKAAKELLG